MQGSATAEKVVTFRTSSKEPVSSNSSLHSAKDTCRLETELEMLVPFRIGSYNSDFTLWKSLLYLPSNLHVQRIQEELGEVEQM